MITCSRYHDISCGHRVYGHEGKCAHLHGHNYRFIFKVAPLSGLDSVGRVVDFSVIKSTLCEWLEENWDHKFLIWEDDPIKWGLKGMDVDGVVFVPFNPTAENIAQYFVDNVAPSLLDEYDCKLVELTIGETEKCSVTYAVDTETHWIEKDEKEIAAGRLGDGQPFGVEEPTITDEQLRDKKDDPCENDDLPF